MSLNLLKKHAFKNGDSLVLNTVTETHPILGQVSYLKLHYASSELDYKTNQQIHYECGVQYFHLNDKALALIDFAHRTKNEPRDYDFSLEEILSRAV